VTVYLGLRSCLASTASSRPLIRTCVLLGKTCLTGKIHIASIEGVDHEDVLRDALCLCKYKYGLAHSTIQVAKDIHLL
jgi:hypothetical protein